MTKRGRLLRRTSWVSLVLMLVVGANASARYLVDSGHVGSITDFELADGGRLLVTAGEDGTVRVFEGNPGRLTATAQVSPHPIVLLAVHPELDRVAVVESDGVAVHLLTVWNLERNRRTFTLRLDEAPLRLEYSPQGSYLVFLKADWTSVVFLDADRGNILRKPGSRSEPMFDGFGIVESFFITQSERTLLSYLPSGTIQYRDISNGELKGARINTLRNLSDLSFIGDQPNRAVGFAEDELIAIDIVSGREVASKRIEGLETIAVDTNSGELIAMRRDPEGELEYLLFEFQSDRFVARYGLFSPPEEKRPSGILFSRRTLYTATQEGEIYRQTRYASSPELLSSRTLVHVHDLLPGASTLIATENDIYTFSFEARVGSSPRVLAFRRDNPLTSLVEAMAARRLAQHDTQTEVDTDGTGEGGDQEADLRDLDSAPRRRVIPGLPDSSVETDPDDRRLDENVAGTTDRMEELDGAGSTGANLSDRELELGSGNGVDSDNGSGREPETGSNGPGEMGDELSVPPEEIPFIGRTQIRHVSSDFYLLFDKGGTAGTVGYYSPVEGLIRILETISKAPITDIKTRQFNLLSASGGSDLAISNVFSELASFEYRGVGVRSVDFADDPFVIVAGQRSGVPRSTTFRINTDTLETVPLPNQSTVTFDLAFDAASGSLYTVSVDTSGAESRTVVVRHYGDDLEFTQTLHTAEGEFFDATVAENHGDVFFSVGGRSFLKRSGATRFREIGNTGGIPAESSIHGRWVYTINRDSSISLISVVDGAYTASLYLFDDKSWVVLSPRGDIIATSDGRRTHLVARR